MSDLVEAASGEEDLAESAPAQEAENQENSDGGEFQEGGDEQVVYITDFR